MNDEAVESGRLTLVSGEPLTLSGLPKDENRDVVSNGRYLGTIRASSQWTYTLGAWRPFVRTKIDQYGKHIEVKQ